MKIVEIPTFAPPKLRQIGYSGKNTSLAATVTGERGPGCKSVKVGAKYDAESTTGQGKYDIKEAHTQGYFPL
jgi:hypothetical protein